MTSKETSEAGYSLLTENNITGETELSGVEETERQEMQSNSSGPRQTGVRPRQKRQLFGTCKPTSLSSRFLLSRHKLKKHSKTGLTPLLLLLIDIVWVCHIPVLCLRHKRRTPFSLWIYKLVNLVAHEIFFPKTYVIHVERELWANWKGSLMFGMANY